MKSRAGDLAGFAMGTLAPFTSASQFTWTSTARSGLGRSTNPGHNHPTPQEESTMSRTFHHSDRKRRTAKLRREGSNRARTRQLLHSGNYDEIPTRMPTKDIRTVGELGQA